MTRILFGLVITGALFAADPNWAQWRGPSASGVAQGGGLPASWSAEKNIAWKVEVPGSGHSQPVVWAKRIFLTTEVEGEAIEGAGAVKHKMGNADFLHPDALGATKKHTLKVLCYSVDTGKLLWEQTAYEGKAYDDRHKRNTYASPTSVTDGETVFAYFESMGLYAYTMEGKLKWKASVGGIATMGMGAGTSPVLAGDLVIIQADQDTGDTSFLYGFSKKDGKEVWRTPRKVQVSWTTPVLAGGQLLASGHESIIAYDPKTGKELWSVPGLKSHAIHTPMLAGDMVVVTSGYPAKRTFGLKLTGEGEGERLVWKYEKGTAYVPTGIVYDGLLYLISDNGSLTCLDPKTGEARYEGKRLPAPARFMASPIAFDGKLFLTSEDGDTYVVKAGPVHEVIATNPLGEPVYSSIAAAGDSLYIRAQKHLYRIRQ